MKCKQGKRRVRVVNKQDLKKTEAPIRESSDQDRRRIIITQP